MRGLRRDKRGVAAVEFAFIAPVMLIMLLGVFEAGRAYAIRNRFTTTTTMVADLIAQNASMTQQELTSLFDIIPHSMGGYAGDAATFDIQILPVIPDRTSATNPPKIYATVPTRAGGAGKVRCLAQTDFTTEERAIVNGKRNVATGLPTGGVLKVIGRYKYAPALNYPGSGFAKADWTMEAVYVPRMGCVTFASQGCTNALTPLVPVCP